MNTKTQALRERILQEKEKGRIVCAGIEGLVIYNLDEFLEQNADGILYDLNRGEEISLSFLDDPKWVNDFAVAQVIRALKSKLELRRILR